MKVTYKGDYALKAILDLSVHYGEGVITIHDLAKRIDAPVKFLEQILFDLRKGGFIESKRGKVGGYLLAKHPSQITLGEVVRFVDGPIEPISCLKKEYANCADSYKCVFKKIWKNVYQQTSNIIDNVTFEQLAQEAGSCLRQPAYSI